jgi:hypothetical protein
VVHGHFLKAEATVKYICIQSLVSGASPSSPASGTVSKAGSLQFSAQVQCLRQFFLPTLTNSTLWTIFLDVDSLSSPLCLVLECEWYGSVSPQSRLPFQNWGSASHEPSSYPSFAYCNSGPFVGYNGRSPTEHSDSQQYWGCPSNISSIQRALLPSIKVSIFRGVYQLRLTVLQLRSQWSD